MDEGLTTKDIRHAFGEVTGTARSLNSPLRAGWPFYAVIISAAAFAAVLVLLLLGTRVLCGRLALRPWPQRK